MRESVKCSDWTETREIHGYTLLIIVDFSIRGPEFIDPRKDIKAK